MNYVRNNLAAGRKATLDDLPEDAKGLPLKRNRAPLPGDKELPGLPMVPEISQAEWWEANTDDLITPETHSLRKLWTAEAITWEAVEIPATMWSLEDWLENAGFSSMRLVSLADLEGKLKATGKTSTKATQVRAWLDTQLQRYGSGVAQASDWADPPFEYEETVKDILLSLSNP